MTFIVLGKIGSGGSIKVHKVISSYCKIYALKRIKLKGRDYATVYGFCQEIGYLNKLKGKNHIIQLIDYEVKAMLPPQVLIPPPILLHIAIKFYVELTMIIGLNFFRQQQSWSRKYCCLAKGSILASQFR